MNVEIWSNSAGKWLPGVAEYLKSDLGMVLVEYEHNGRELRKTVRFYSKLCRQVGPPTLAGMWELIHDGWLFEVWSWEDNLWYEEEEKGKAGAQRGALRQSGSWYVADCDRESVRLRLGPSGHSVTFQRKPRWMKEWGERFYATRPGGLDAGREMVTTAVAKLHTTSSNNTLLGYIPPGMRVFAGGLAKVGSRGVRKVPLQPKGAVHPVFLRVLEPDEEEDDAAELGGAFGDLRTLLEALEGGDTVLLKGTWLCSWADECCEPLPRRQEIPAEALWKPAELRPLVLARRVQLVAISYCWITEFHPDPEGVQLRTLADAVTVRLAERTMPIEDVAIFLDWCSLYQYPRSKEEGEAFTRGLAAVNLWYAHAETMVLTMTKLPEHVKCRGYDDRGWPYFEKQVSSMLKDSSRLLDLGMMESSDNKWLALAEKCKQGRKPPLTPEEFATEIQRRTFVNKADHEFVILKYRDTYREVLGHAITLDFSGLGWGEEDAKKLAVALGYCECLEKLALVRNTLGPKGMIEIAKCFPQLTRLREIHLWSTEMKDDGAIYLADVMPRCKSLRVILLQTNGITCKGAKCLAAAMPLCPTLERINLTENTIGPEGVEALIRAIGDCRNTALRQLELFRKIVDEADQLRLRAAWEAAGKRPEWIYF